MFSLNDTQRTRKVKQTQILKNKLQLKESGFFFILFQDSKTTFYHFNRIQQLDFLDGFAYYLVSFTGHQPTYSIKAAVTVRYPWPFEKSFMLPGCKILTTLVKFLFYESDICGCHWKLFGNWHQFSQTYACQWGNSKVPVKTGKPELQ